MGRTGGLVFFSGGRGLGHGLGLCLGLGFGLSVGLGLVGACSSSGTSTPQDLALVVDQGQPDFSAFAVPDMTVPPPDLYVVPPDMAARVGTMANPGSSCQDIKQNRGNMGDGSYYIKSAAGAPLLVTCDMNTDDGGWTVVTPEVAQTLKAGVGRAYLYRKGAGWYRSPTSTLTWDWNTSQELTGTWFYYDANVMDEKAFACNGSAEKPAFGIGCSNGPGATLKTLPNTTKDPVNGTATVCQDQPGIFAGACSTLVTILVR